MEDVEGHKAPWVVDEGVKDETQREAQQGKEEGVGVTQPPDDATWRKGDRE